ncbi:hypothetical protein BKA65DRAFT_487637 [Rhexocercosporidium sp. MPI-PUGE-AT-0058]|nr:hypothetical protein BKA65DRAFT_487637 [Rhexocercosporidium sp. MPI-PUGE-AT-0058]
MNKTTTDTIPVAPHGRTRIGNKHDIPGNGFIRLAPRTHDISLVGEHIPNIAHLAADLQVAVNAGWSRRHNIRYCKVQVLLLKWQDDDLGVETELKDLGHVFADLFHYGVDVFDIPSEKPDKALKRRVFDFLENDADETLLILYYAGHARSSIQANEAPIWIANRRIDSPSLPSGGIQSMFEEADADVLLLYDCCNSAATAESSSTQPHKGVTEVIAACGYETIAPEVGEHSFSNALSEVLAASSKGRPFSVAELHTKILTRLKCWTPSFVKDDKGKRKEDQEGRLLFERQPRRTPIYSIICETEPRRSIIMAPLESFASKTDTSSSHINNLTAGPSSSRSPSVPNDHARKRKRPVDESIEYPQVLLAIRLEKHDLDIEAWKECLLRQLPPEAKEIKIEGIYGSFSTLLLLRLPLEVWDLLPENRAYSFVGFVTTPNVMSDETNTVESTEVADSNLFDFSQMSSSGKSWSNMPFRPQSREATPTFAFRFNSMSPRDVVLSPPSSSRSSSQSSTSPPRSLSPVMEDEEYRSENLVIELLSSGANFTIEELRESDAESLNDKEVVWPTSYSDAEEIDPGIQQDPGPTHVEIESDSDVDGGDEYEEFLHKRMLGKRRMRHSGGSISKRTLSESIGSDTDDEDLKPVTFLDANNAGSSARRLRRRMGERTSLIFDDPPPRIDEMDEPESCDELVDVERARILSSELPFHLSSELPLDLEEL